MIPKRNTVVVRYVNVALLGDVKGLPRKHPGESVEPVTEISLEMNAMPTTADPTNRASPCAKNSTNVKNVTRKPEDHMCGEKMCWNCEEFVDPNRHRCYMKPIANQEEDSDEAHEALSKRKKNNKGQRNIRRISEEMISDEVEDEDIEEEEGQEYLFFDIESR